MFQTVTIEDSVRVKPDQLGRPIPDAVKATLSDTFTDKVVPEVGLVVSIYDILEINGGFISSGDGAAHFDVKFRLVVFRPFEDEVIVGRLIRCSTKGLHIDLGFFKDIVVPQYAMADSTKWNEEEKLWCWEWDGQPMYFDLDQDIRFRVHAVKFHPVPTKADMQEALDKGEEVVGSAATPYAPMEIIGDVKDPGLGLVSWWAAEDDMQQGDEADAE